MSAKKEHIRKALEKLAGNVGPVPTLLATVHSVDEAALTCTLDDEGFLYFDVRLRPVVNGKESVTLVPVVGSYVLAARIEDDEEFMVIACDEIKSYRIVAESLEFEMSGGKFRIKKGEETLGKLVDDLLAARLTEQHAVAGATTTGLQPTAATAITNLRTRFSDFLTLD
jgi:hypothetical protein